MNRRTMILSVFLATTLSWAPVARAQQPAAVDNWSAVQALAVGDELKIRTKDGKSVKGKLVTVTDANLTITRKGKDEIVPKEKIAQVHQSKRKAEKGKYAAIGAGVGTGVFAGSAFVSRVGSVFLAIGLVLSFA